jgi:hypothetical protein
MSSTATFVGDEIDQTSYAQSPVAVAEQPQPAPAPTSAQPLSVEIECLCPFCGSLNAGVGRPCAHCKFEKARDHKSSSNPASDCWFVLQPDNADAPGISFKELVHQVRRQVVTSRSVVRGPATGQLYRLASKIRGLSREFGQCYSCGGDIETDETICPHCDRVQTLVEPSRSAAVASETLAAKQVRHALLSDPVVHVHSLSHPEPAAADMLTASRPVVAEHTSRHVPKDDLLTPRDVAKAFQLQFGVERDQTDRFFSNPANYVRTIKIGLTSIASLAVAFAIIWPLTHMNSESTPYHPAYQPTVTFAQKPAASAPMLYADARNTTVVSFDPSASVPSTPVPSTVVSSTPTPAAARLTPGDQSEPEPTVSPEDDPRLLWSAAMDAESSGNYAAAVQAYERIQSLPSDSWPAKLQTRLSLARKELKGDVR